MATKCFIARALDENSTLNHFYKFLFEASKKKGIFKFFVFMNIHLFLGHYYHIATIFDHSCLLIDST